MFYGGPTGLKEKPEAKITVPVTPKFASDARIRSRQMKGSNSGHDVRKSCWVIFFPKCSCSDASANDSGIFFVLHVNRHRRVPY